MITVYRVLEEMETIDRNDLLVWDGRVRETKDHEKKLVVHGKLAM